MKNTMLALLLLLAFPVSGFCGTSNGTDLKPDQVQQLKNISEKIAVVHELADRHVITDAQATAATNLYCKDAGQIVGHDVTPTDIQTLVANAAATEGLPLFWNIVVVIAGILALLAVLGLFAYYLAPILEAIPAGMWELLAYAGTAVLCLCGYLWHPFHLGFVLVDPLWFTIPGAAALAGCIYNTYLRHFKSAKDDTVLVGPGFVNFPTVMFGLLTVAWGAMAVFYHQIFPDAGIPYFFAFCAVMALQACLGFSVITMPGCIAMGWETDRQVPKSVLSSFLILAGYVFLKLTNRWTGDAALFESGSVFMGAFVYYLGLLVMSNKYYLWSGKHDGRETGRYMLLQLLTIVSGVAALYLGSVFHMGALLGVGGTFFAIYLLEKYYELPWKGVGWAWSFLGLAAILYFVVAFANANPQYFVWGIR